MLKNRMRPLLSFIFCCITYAEVESFTGHIGAGFDSSFHKYNSPNKEQSVNLELALNHTLSETHIGVLSNFSKKLVETEKLLWEDTLISFTRALDLFPDSSHFSLNGKLGITVGNSERSKNEKSMYGIIAISPTVNWSKDSGNISLIPTAGKVINKYKTTTEGESNASHYIKLTLKPSYSFRDKYIAYVKVSATQQWTENGNTKPAKYGNAIGAEVKLAAKTIMNFDITTDDTLYKSDGTSLNMNLYDNSLSHYSIQITQEF